MQVPNKTSPTCKRAPVDAKPNQAKPSQTKPSQAKPSHPAPTMPIDEHVSKRLTQLELQLMHLEKDFDSLNEVVLQHGRKLDELTRLVTRLNTKLDSRDDEPEQRDPLAEKPPHY